LNDPITSFNSYQAQAHSFAAYSSQIDSLDPALREAATFLYASSKLCGEAGEVAEKLAKQVRDKGVTSFSDISPEDRLALGKELGDCLWYISEIAQRLGFSLSEIATMNVDKLQGRIDRGTLLGSGDDR
jgi:NTP pyrophosphatase (non-canonical NTP hydrolase)